MIEVGNRVALSAAWLRSTGQMTGDIGFARGVVTRIIKLGETSLAEVVWENGRFPKRVNVNNLAIVGPNTKFCQC